MPIRSGRNEAGIIRRGFQREFREGGGKVSDQRWTLWDLPTLGVRTPSPAGESSDTLNTVLGVWEGYLGWLPGGQVADEFGLRQRTLSFFVSIVQNTCQPPVSPKPLVSSLLVEGSRPTLEAFFQSS